MTDREKECQHIVSSEEGTSYCKLAESNGDIKDAKIAELRELVRAKDAALKISYEHNQNMHCYKTSGNLNKELNRQTIVLREALQAKERT